MGGSRRSSPIRILVTSTHDLSGVNAQASDVSFLISYAASLPDTDMTRLAAMGFSWGGLADLFAASRDKRIKALVSLDGSEHYSPAWLEHPALFILNRCRFL